MQKFTFEFKPVDIYIDNGDVKKMLATAVIEGAEAGATGGTRDLRIPLTANTA